LVEGFSEQGGLGFFQHPNGRRIRENNAVLPIRYQDTVPHAIDNGFDLRFFRCNVLERLFTLPSKKRRLFLEGPFFQGPSYDNTELIRREGFGNKIISPFFIASTADSTVAYPVMTMTKRLGSMVRT